MISRSSRSCKRFRVGGFPEAGTLPKTKTDGSSALSSWSSPRGPLPLASVSPSSWQTMRSPSPSSWQRMRNTTTNTNTYKNTNSSTRRSFFTNGETTKKDDPYAILGLQWGDGATTAEIRQAFRERAKALHPDVVDTTIMTTEQAHDAFQQLAGAYEALMKHVQAEDCENMEEWRVSLWRQSDRIAVDRTDVAGVARKRPAKPAQTAQRMNYGRELGHPSGKGVAARAEYLSDGATTTTNAKKLRSSSVGRGQSKWVKTKQTTEYKEWQPSR